MIEGTCVNREGPTYQEVLEAGERVRQFERSQVEAVSKLKFPSTDAEKATVIRRMENQGLIAEDLARQYIEPRDAYNETHSGQPYVEPVHDGLALARLVSYEKRVMRARVKESIPENYRVELDAMATEDREKVLDQLTTNALKRKFNPDEEGAE